MQNTAQMRFMTITSLLAALVVLLGLTPLGFINVGVIYITFLCVPVIVGTLSMGLKCGMILGFCMGSVSLYTAFRAPSALVTPIMQDSIIWVLLMCYIPRFLVPLLAWEVRKHMHGNKKAMLLTASAAGSFTNTVFYLGLMLVFYQLLGLENTGLLATVGTIVLTAGVPEAIAAALISCPVVLALEKAGLISKID